MRLCRANAQEIELLSSLSDLSPWPEVATKSERALGFMAVSVRWAKKAVCGRRMDLSEGPMTSPLSGSRLSGPVRPRAAMRMPARMH